MPTNPSKVLFAISDTGGGHRSAAVAISAALDAASDGIVSSAMLDVLQVTNVPGLRAAPQLYDQLSTRWLPLYDFTFQLTNGVRRVDVLSRIVSIQARRNVARALQSIQPELVVVTHPLVHRFVCSARTAYRLPFRIVTVVTDLVSIHAAWTYPGLICAFCPPTNPIQRCGGRACALTECFVLASRFILSLRAMQAPRRRRATN
ncbi:MAG: hypothetical protein MI924_09360 [Chloroflexales bacterium]|nr:hypothetical protein [Chloroflexales bacterium]